MEVAFDAASRFSSSGMYTGNVTPARWRPNSVYLALLCLLFIATSAYPIDITLSTGVWNADVSTCLPTEAGADFFPTAVESATNQTILTVAGSPNNFTWTVTVQKTDTAWHTGLKLYVRRTSTHTSVSGGTSYQEVTATAMNFFWSTVNKLEVYGITCQYQLTGLSVVMGTSNTTTVTYTVLKN